MKRFGSILTVLVMLEPRVLPVILVFLVFLVQQIFDENALSEVASFSMKLEVRTHFHARFGMSIYYL